MEQFVEKVNLWPWNNTLNENITPIVPAIHGTSMKIGWKIVNSGFAALSTIDEGYYGKGIYLSTSALYTLPYFASCSDPAIIVCLTIPGNPFPVVHNPTEEENLLGKPIKSGYTSHYVVTNKSGVIYQPKVDNKKYDEIVIEQEAQIIPMFLVSIDKVNFDKLSSEYLRKIPTNKFANENSERIIDDSDIGRSERKISKNMTDDNRERIIDVNVNNRESRDYKKGTRNRMFSFE